MKEFWDQLIFDNPIKKYVGVLLAILVGLMIKRIISRFIAGQLFRAATKLDKGIDKSSFVKLLLNPLEIFLITFISFAAIEKLRFPVVFDFEIYEVNFKSIVHGAAKTIIIIEFIWLLLRAIDFISLLLKEKARIGGGAKDLQLVVFFRDFLKVIIGIIGVLMILGIAFGFEVSKLWTGLGLAGAALALSLKESIENLIASFIIFFDKPFMAGDVLKVNNITGTVEKIGLRSTRIRTDQKTYVTIPNKQMVDSVVDNQTLRTFRKAEIRLQFESSTSASTIESFVSDCRKLFAENDVYTPTVYLNDISGTSYQVNIDYFTTPIPIEQFNEIKQRLHLEILKIVERYKIATAGSGMTVRMEKLVVTFVYRVWLTGTIDIKPLKPYNMKKIFFFLMMLFPAYIFAQQDSVTTSSHKDSVSATSTKDSIPATAPQTSTTTTTNNGQGKKPHHSLGLGIKAGLNFTNINSASGISNSSETGYQVGIFLDPESHSLLGSRTELVYSRQGYNYSTGLTTGGVNLDYIMLAQLLAINITHFVQIQVGTQFAYLINAKSDSTQSGTGYALLDYYNRFDFGFSGGLEVRPFMGFLIGGRYNFSLTNLYKLPSSNTNVPPSFIPSESDLNLKNNLLQIYVGYRF